MSIKTLSSASVNEKKVFFQKYKILRNKVTSTIRKEGIDHNNNRVMEANNESELWKIANEVTSSRPENIWKIVFFLRINVTELYWDRTSSVPSLSSFCDWIRVRVFDLELCL